MLGAWAPAQTVITPPRGCTKKGDADKMSTLVHDNKFSESTLLRSNPILRRLSKVTEHSDSDAASYRGIAAKVSFFLLLTLVGLVAQLLVGSALAAEPVWKTFEFYEKFTVTLCQKEVFILIAVVLTGFVSNLVGIFARRSIPVTGSLYSLSQGYLISFLVFKVLKGYEYLGLEALVLTAAVVAVMSWLYTSGVIRGGSKFNTVLFTLIVGSILMSLFCFLGSLIPVTRPYITAMLHNPVISIGLNIVGILIAALFLISDFSLIDSCVRDGMPRQYEWSAAFGLAFTVIWL